MIVIPPNIRIRELSPIARLAAAKLKSKAAAIVMGKTIHLYGVSRKNFLADENWVRHELVHIEQFRRYGFLPFISKYLLEWVKKGYYHNRFEVEARKAEKLSEK